MKLCYKEMSYAKAIRAVFRLHSFPAAFVSSSIGPWIVNDDFGVYKNELQIALNDHEDERKNKVGRIKDDELFLKVCKETRSFKDVMNCLFFGLMTHECEHMCYNN